MGGFLVEKLKVSALLIDRKGANSAAGLALKLGDFVYGVKNLPLSINREVRRINYIFYGSEMSECSSRHIQTVDINAFALTGGVSSYIESLFCGWLTSR